MSSLMRAYAAAAENTARRKAKDLTWSEFNRICWIVFRTVLLLGICYLILFPLLSKISASFMTRNDLWDRTVAWIPRYGTLANYRLAWAYMEYPRAFLNSLTLSLSVSVFQLISCTLVGYGFARFPLLCGRLLFALVVLTLIIPPEMIMIPLYISFRYFDAWGLLPHSINLLNSFWPFILMSLTATALRNGLFIYIMRQFFRGMPLDLEEAAYVDGAGSFRTFAIVMLPGAIPALVIVFLFAFVWQWNDYALTSAFAGRMMVLPLMLDGLAERVIGSRFGHAPEESSLLNSTGSLLLILPVLVLYLTMQRYFIESVQRTGLGGG